METRIILLSLCSVFAVQLPVGHVHAQSVYYVSPSASTVQDGSINSPFQSIHRAVEAASSDKRDATIYVKGGTYYLTEPIVLTSKEGNESKSLVIKAVPGEKVVLSGGKKLDLTWKPYKDGIMQAKVSGNPIMDMLVVNGQIRQMARFPNYDEKAVRFNGTSSLATAKEKVKKWKHPEGGYLHAMHKHDWGDFHYRITGKSRQGELYLEGGWQNNRPMGLHAENRMVENIFEELDVPGEWFYNKEKGILYYYPLPDEDIDNATIETPQLKSLIEFVGSASAPVKHITIAGIDLTQTVRTFMESYEPLLRSDWTIYRGGAVAFRGTENCELKDCSIYNVGGNAVFFDKYNRYSSVTGTHFTLVGASAICFVGDTEAVRSPSFRYEEFVPVHQLDLEKGPKNDNYPAFCRVHDNLITKIGLFEKQVTGIELSMCYGITISHNSIYDMPRAGINISEGTWGGHVIEYNDIFNTVKETGDHGSINSWGRDRFWHPDYQAMTEITRSNPGLILADMLSPIIIRNNRLRCDRGWDIDLDDGSSNYQIYNNLCLNGGIKLREGFYRTVENNILINNTLHPHLWFPNNGDVFSRNIVMTAYKPINVYGWGQMVDYNIFTDSLSYQAARKRENDAHSIVTTITFAEPDKGNFAIADDNDAITKGGFRNFSMDSFGVLSARLKSMAQIPLMPVPMMAGNVQTNSVLDWKGALLKKLDTLGERSATGMDEERGIYVVSINALGSSVRDYLAANDVILAVNGKDVNSLEEVTQALKQAEDTDKMVLTVFRYQMRQQIVIPLK